MTHEPNQPSPATAAGAEPTALKGRVPVWLFVWLYVAVFAGLYYFDHRSGWFNTSVYGPYKSLAEVQKFQPVSGGASLARGKAAYETVCALCHNNDGTGKPNQAPPVAGSEWVVGSPNRLIRIPLVGLTGPIQVKGEQWNLAMPAMGATLSDDDLAAVLTYMRSAWGNKAPEITPQQVKAVRAELGNRSQPFTGTELSSVPEK